MNAWLADLQHALRRLARTPGFASAAIIMLTLGIGFSVAMVSTVDGVLLRGLPFPHGERLVLVRAQNPGQGVVDAQLTLAEAERLEAGTPGFAALGHYWWSGSTLFDGTHAREITTHVVSGGYFGVLGLEPLLGRALDADDMREGRAVAVLSETEWRRHFAGDPSVVGRMLELVDEDAVEIVGVMPAAIEAFAGETGLWRPLASGQLPQDPAWRSQRRMLFMLGRLDSGTSRAAADAALAQRFAALRAEGIGAEGDWTATARPLLDGIVGDARAALWGAFALAVLLLLIAAATVAILFDARQAARNHEFAVLQAIGASRARVRRGLLFELGLVSAAGAVLGSVLAGIAVGVLREFAQDSIPRVDGIVVDVRMIVFAIGLATLVPAIAAIAGALELRSGPADAIRRGGKGLVGRRGSRRLLPALATALSTVSLVTALTLAGGLWRLQAVDPGFHAERVEVMQFFRVGREALVPFGERVLERLRAVPGVREAALTSAPPLSGIGSASIGIEVVGMERADAPQAGLRRVSADYRALLGTPLVAGRDFSADDRRGSEAVAIVNQTLARRLFGDASPLDARLRLPVGRGEPVVCRVIGVVADIRNAGLRMTPEPEVLVPFAQQPINAMSFLVRTTPAAGPSVTAQMAALLHELDPRQPITRAYALAGDLADPLRTATFFARVVAAFAALALVLAVFGVYAVASLQQRRRVGEYGLRLAVGARPLRLALGVLRESLVTSAIGVGLGTLAVFALLRALDMAEAGSGGVSVAAFVAGIAAMGFAALAAAAMPAVRAARVAPMEALRDD